METSARLRQKLNKERVRQEQEAQRREREREEEERLYRIRQTPLPLDYGNRKLLSSEIRRQARLEVAGLASPHQSNDVRDIIIERDKEENDFVSRMLVEQVQSDMTAQERQDETLLNHSPALSLELKAAQQEAMFDFARAKHESPSPLPVEENGWKEQMLDAAKRLDNKLIALESSRMVETKAEQNEGNERFHAEDQSGVDIQVRSSAALQVSTRRERKLIDDNMNDGNHLHAGWRERQLNDSMEGILQPFCRIGEVSAGSQAASIGFKSGDQILDLGGETRYIKKI